MSRYLKPKPAKGLKNLYLLHSNLIKAYIDTLKKYQYHL
ncbi:hypothetical protein C900_02977 [Fulvivirga imtechensis AK7]|uniref:Uncharacterized protein n=1 Tax=Fulvivirga imtechensis AK7 TaxID=1237149 RepID=L8JSJ3_9BACT|nr:hypothetical protein C900_02977 [Fulvivirga imtechensis AK7]